MFSFRLRVGRVLLCALVLVLAVTLGTMGIRALFGASAVSTGGSVKLGQRVTVKTNEQRLDFMAAFGWEVVEDPVEVMEVIIPKEFDEVYVEYNALQQKMGYDLERYAGKRCKRYTYEITNYPGQPEDVRLNILVIDDKVVGGDICSLKTDGFMHGFEAEEPVPMDTSEAASPTAAELPDEATESVMAEGLPEAEAPADTDAPEADAAE